MSKGRTPKCTYSSYDGCCGYCGTWNGFCAPGNKKINDKAYRDRCGVGTSGVRDVKDLKDVE